MNSWPRQWFTVMRVWFLSLSLSFFLFLSLFLMLKSLSNEQQNGQIDEESASETKRSGTVSSWFPMSYQFFFFIFFSLYRRFFPLILSMFPLFSSFNCLLSPFSGLMLCSKPCPWFMLCSSFLLISNELIQHFSPWHRYLSIFDLEEWNSKFSLYFHLMGSIINSC